MVKRLVAVSLVVALGGCFSSGNDEEVAEPSSATSTTATPTTTTTTTVPKLWGEEAFEFFEALRYVVPDRVGLFYSPTMILEGSPIWDSPLEEDLGDLEVVLIRALRSPAAERLFLASDQAALEGDLAEHPFLPGLWLCEVVDGRIVRVTLETLQGFEGYWRDPDPLGPRLGALHERYFTAWTSGDADRIADLYQPGAIRTDGLFGSTQRIRPEEELGDLPVETLVGDTPRYQAVQTTGDLDGDGRVTEEAAVFTVEEWREEASAAHVMFDIKGSDCTVGLLAEWEIEGDLIAAEEILYDVESLRRCADRAGVDLPDGWWTGMEVPEPFIAIPVVERITGQVTAGDGSRIDIINGTPEQIELVEWGLGRFAAAGMALPQVATIAFPPSGGCEQSMESHATLGAEFVRIDLCMSEDDAAHRHIVLHELGHVWEYQNLDEATRQAFLQSQGLEDGTTPGFDTWWAEGAEQAAWAIAWGLTDQTTSTWRLEDMAEAFRLLTGVEPLNTP